MSFRKAASHESIRRKWYGTVALVLFAVAGMKLYTAFGSERILDSNDPILKVPYRWLMVSLAILETGIAALVLAPTKCRLKGVAVLWLGANFVAYHATAYYLDVQTCPCLGKIGDVFGLPPEVVQVITMSLAAYLLIGSAYFLAAGNTCLPRTDLTKA